jgi:hypothetical protein
LSRKIGSNTIKPTPGKEPRTAETPDDDHEQDLERMIDLESAGFDGTG